MICFELAYIISALCLFSASADALSKKSLVKSNEYLVAWVHVGFAAPFCCYFFPL